MRAAVTSSPGEMVIEDVSGSGRRARPGHVIVRPEAVGVCGSDFHLFSGALGALSGVRDFYPRVQGHEMSAIVGDPGLRIRSRNLTVLRGTDEQKYPRAHNTKSAENDRASSGGRRPGDSGRLQQ